MKKIALIAFVAMMPLNAYAASVEDPVKAVMTIAVSRWQPESSGTDYFEKPHLDANYSKAFVAVYHQAEKYPAYDEGGTPFDYDVITNGQDGCPLKDLKIAPGGEKDGVTAVDVSFRLWDCAETAEDKAKISELKFDVITEDGRPVINDIHRKTDGKWDSLIGEMQETMKARQ
ncbi:MAG: hypothetical protein JWM58_613 [Rhizobium sp.]|nr:hypothetical protein [Rhizobium sp.]